MRRPSVADSLVADTRRRIREMTPGDRLALTEQLAREDLALFCAAHGLSEEEGRRLMVRQRRRGRRPSRVMDRDP